ncbi:MAG: hypothetical protein WCV93_06030 [Candidatus Shapirobacteria bacterium]|jgi:hypothetical protein
MFSKLVVPLLVVLLVFTRFYGLNWGNGFFFQPDENNMGMAVSRLSFNNLNPDFFAYGQFPLYLSFFSLKILGIANSFINSIYILRFWSAVFSVLGIISLYLFFKNKLFLLLLIFSPGLIQIAHFGTTESLLFFVFTANLYLSRKKSVFLVALISGLGIATKISAIFFILPVVLSLRPKKIVIFLILTAFFTALLSPYNIVSFQDFISSMNYETGVATGKIAVFYTRQFINTTPYLFQFTHIFPYTSGLPVFILAVIGFFLLFTKYHVPRSKYLVISLSCLIYFLYFGQLFTKWTRFMSPIFFVFPLLASLVINKIKIYPLKIVLIIICLLPGLSFFRIYLQNDIRQTASVWLNNNLPVNSNILSEGGNVVNLPLFNNRNLDVTNFDFYNLDYDPVLQSQLPDLVSTVDYVLIPSRRIFMNQDNPHFSSSQSYYQALFSGQSGFKLTKTFSLHNNFILNDELAEETWTVFDRPTIRLYKKMTP